MKANPEKQRDQIMTRHKKILNDLKTINTIDKNDKLIIEEDEIIIHPYSSTRSFVRWWNNYSRVESINFLKNLYDSISLYIIDLTSISIKTDINMKKRKHRKLKREANKNKIELIKACKESKQGLLHLIITYKDDEAFRYSVNNIFSIIDKLD